MHERHIHLSAFFFFFFFLETLFHFFKMANDERF